MRLKKEVEYNSAMKGRFRARKVSGDNKTINKKPFAKRQSVKLSPDVAAAPANAAAAAKPKVGAAIFAIFAIFAKHRR